MPLTRRELLLGLVSMATTAGCARFRPGLTGEGRDARDVAITIYPFRRTDIEALQTPSIGVTLGDSIPGVMFLTHYETGGGLRWESTNHYGLVTRGGRVVATRGLRRDLAATRFESPDPLLERPPSLSGVLTRQLDLMPGDNRAVRYESRFEPRGEEFLTILERTYRATRVSETVTVKRWQWHAENTYWLEAGTGSVIRSIQHIAPDSPLIVIDLLRPPA